MPGAAAPSAAAGTLALPGGCRQANAGQCLFPIVNAVADGHAGTAPVGGYPPDDYGLHDLAGNAKALATWP